MLNHITIMGRFTRDPELRHTQIGTAVTSFTLAVDRDFKDKNTGESATDWISCTAWKGTAEFAISRKAAWPSWTVVCRPGATRTGTGTKEPPWRWWQTTCTSETAGRKNLRGTRRKMSFLIQRARSSPNWMILQICRFKAVLV